MQAIEEMQTQMRDIARQLFTTLEVHEREAHNGAACMSNRASAIAYLAHGLGVRSEWWAYAETLLREYDANCTATDCLHGLTSKAAADPLVHTLQTEPGKQFAMEAIRAGDASGIAWNPGLVILIIGTQQAGMTPDAARRYAEAILRAADQADGKPTQEPRP